MVVACVDTGNKSNETRLLVGLVLSSSVLVGSILLNSSCCMGLQYSIAIFSLYCGRGDQSVRRSHVGLVIDRIPSANEGVDIDF